MEYSFTVLRKRIFAGMLILLVLFLIVIVRVFTVQIADGKELREKAVDQWTRELPLIAPRGRILDRNGVVLVDNKSAYAVFVRPRSVKDPEKTAVLLSKEFSLDYEKLLKKIKSNVSEYTVKRHITSEQFERVKEYNLEGVYFSEDPIRYYPYGDFLTQTLGYVSYDNEGQSGIEKQYDELLRGKNGEILYETDIVGLEIEETGASYIPAVQGLDLTLTIDYEIQQIAEQAMQIAYITHSPKRAECIVIDPSTGEILALASKPSYDLNNIPREDIALLNKLSRNGLIADNYEPGSTFKILTAAADLEEFYNGNPSALSPDYIFNSSRYRTVLGRNIKCWRSHADGKHSNQTIKEALNNSCNPCFVDMALALGKEKFYSYIKKVNYGSKTGVDFIGEANGMLIPEKAVTDGDLARIGFGQTIAVTPVQLAAATASVVNGGNYYTPHLLKEVFSSSGVKAQTVLPELKNKTFSEKTSRLMASYLEGVVSEGSGKHAYIEGYKVGGKTGTAQKYENGVIAQGKYVSSFVGFFPSDDPKYLVLVIVDEPVGQHYGSIVAAPYAKSIFEGIIGVKKIKPQN